MSGDPTTNIRRLPIPEEADQLDWYPDDETGPALPGQLTETGYQLPAGLSIGRWLAIGETLQRMERSVNWWLGDWWNYGDRSYGEMAPQAAKDRLEDATGHSYQVLRNAGWVASKFEFATRVANLSWTHHRVVAELESPDDRAALLTEAVEEQLSTRDLIERTKERKAVISLEAAKVKPMPAPAAVSPLASVLVADARYLPLADGSVDLIVTSPPYGVDVAYGVGDVEAKAWRDFTAHWLVEALRVTVDSGRLALNVPLDTTRGGFRPTYAQAVEEAIEAGWTYRTTIVWVDDQLGKSTARGSLDSATAPHIIAPVEMIALFSKGAWKRTSERPSTLDRQDWLDWTSGWWRIVGETKPWEGHPAPFPYDVPRRLVNLLSFADDLVLDPFCGSGTTVLAGVQAKRRAIGVDLDPHNVRSTIRRLAQ